MSQLGRGQGQQPSIVLRTPAGQVAAAVADTETATTTTAANVSGAGTQPIVVADLNGTYWELQRQRPTIIVATPPGLVSADVAATETASTTATAATGAAATPTETATTTTAATVAGGGTQPIVVADLTSTYWSQQRQRPAIVSMTPPGQVTAAVTDTESAATTATASTGAAVTDTETATTTTAATVTGQGTPPIVVSDLTGTYWTLQRQRPAIVVISPPGKTTADVADTETATTTATASATAPATPPQPVVYSDQLAPYLRRAAHHQPPALLIAPPAGRVQGQVTDTITALTTATAAAAGPASVDVAAAEIAQTTATASTGTVQAGSWYSLIAVLQQSSQDVGQREREDAFCPNDGQRYQENVNGERACPFDGYRPDGCGVGHEPDPAPAGDYAELLRWHRDARAARYCDDLTEVGW